MQKIKEIKFALELSTNRTLLIFETKSGDKLYTRINTSVLRELADLSKKLLDEKERSDYYQEN